MQMSEAADSPPCIVSPGHELCIQNAIAGHDAFCRGACARESARETEKHVGEGWGLAGGKAGHRLAARDEHDSDADGSPDVGRPRARAGVAKTEDRRSLMFP